MSSMINLSNLNVFNVPGNNHNVVYGIHEIGLLARNRIGNVSNGKSLRLAVFVDLV